MDVKKQFQEDILQEGGKLRSVYIDILSSSVPNHTNEESWFSPESTVVKNLAHHMQYLFEEVSLFIHRIDCFYNIDQNKLAKKMTPTFG